jgi:hypothetical protein
MSGDGYQYGPQPGMTSFGTVSGYLVSSEPPTPTQRAQKLRTARQQKKSDRVQRKTKELIEAGWDRLAAETAARGGFVIHFAKNAGKD